MQPITSDLVQDVAKLSLAMNAGFGQLDGEKQTKTVQFLSQKAPIPLIKAVAKHIRDFLKTSPGGQTVLGRMQIARLAGNDPVEMLVRLGPPTTQFLLYLSLHEGVLEQFAGANLGGFRRLVVASKLPSPQDQLQQLARIPAASPTHMWMTNLVRRTAEVVTGVLLTAEELEALTRHEIAPLVQEVRQTKVALAATDPLTPRGADAVEDQAQLDLKIQEVATSLDPEQGRIAKTLLAQAKTAPLESASSVAKQLKLSPEQETAMLAEGLVQITAAAGSGKTRVLAGKIVHHIQQGVPPRSIIATSFTRKSAAELRERIISYGGVGVLDGAEGYVGTTHSVAGSLVREYGPPNRLRIASEGLQEMTLRIALAQVEMRPRSPSSPPKRPIPILSELSPLKGSSTLPSRKDKSVYFKEPANQWFNRGTKVGLPSKKLSTMISNWKGNMISPSEAWTIAEGEDLDDSDSDLMDAAATYAAYEWLKRNDPIWAGQQDFDDMLLEAVRLLTDPSKLELIQRRFKVICVDEAQDQNALQDLLFGLIAGTYDPHTLKDHPDDRHTALVYAKIGDGDQSIYRFRGARPGLFIRNSDQVVTDGVPGKFKTYMVSTNYRSGSNIVNAAQKLIQLNQERVPMVCRADPTRRGEGSIQYVRVGTSGEGAELVASQIEESRKVTEGGSYSDYGIATRTNAEAYGYVMSLMQRGIPFRSKLNPLQEKRTRQLLHWFELLAPEGGGEQNKALLEAHRMPGFMLDTQFGQRVAELSRTTREPSYLRVLQRQWNSIYEGNQAWRNQKSVRPYLEAILSLREKNLPPYEMSQEILNLIGLSGKSFLDELVESIRGDEELMGKAEQEAGTSEEELKTFALAPIRPILGLLGAYQEVGGALDYIHRLQEVSSRSDKSESEKEPAVQVDTVHGWKGLETNHLYVPMPKDVFPSKKATTMSDIEEERRLAYVALTRGRESVTVIAPDVSESKKPAGPSPFIEEACISEVHMTGYQKGQEVGDA